MNHKEFNVKNILIILKENKISIILITMIAVMISVYINIYIAKPYYEVNTKIFVGKENSKEAVYNSNDIEVYKNLIKTYSEIVMTDDFISNSLKKNKINISTNIVQDRLSVTPGAETQILGISYVSYDKNEAQKVVAAISNEIVDEMKVLIPNINTKVIETPKLPSQPVGPRIKINILVSLVCALIMSIGLAFFREYINNSVKDAEAVETETGIKVIGKIPFNRKCNEKIFKINRMNLLETQEYEILCTRIEKLKEKEHIKSIVITSADIMEGKSIIAGNLSLMLANSGRKVLLIECNSRRPILKNYLKLDKELGITDILTGNCEKHEAMIKYTSLLTILINGSKTDNLLELFSSYKTQEIFESFKDEFDYIIIDSPAIKPFTDSILLSKKADAAIMVTRALKTDMDLLCEKCRLLNDMGGRIAGIILNGVRNKSIRKYEKYYGTN